MLLNEVWQNSAKKSAVGPFLRVSSAWLKGLESEWRENIGYGRVKTPQY